MAKKRILPSGFYSRSFSELELQDLDVLTAGLADEIAALRVHTRRLVELASQSDLDLQDMIAVLSALGTSFTRIAQLSRTQAAITGQENPSRAAISQALDEVLREMKLK